MIAKYAIALIVLIVLAAVFAWAFLPARYLPGNRARHLRIRLHLRLHPGKGFAHVFSLWLRWGRLAVLRRSGRIRPSLPLWYRIADPGQHSVFLGRAHYRHGLRVPLEEHLLVMAPPRTHKTAFLANVILDYPGPVIATSTKPDLYALTGAVRTQHGRVHVFNPQHIGGVASTFCWDPVAGCEDPATAIRRADAFAFAVSQKGVEDGTFWSAKASDYLRGTSVRPLWPATTCAPSRPGWPAPTPMPPSGSCSRPAPASGPTPWPNSAPKPTRPPPRCGCLWSCQDPWPSWPTPPWPPPSSQVLATGSTSPPSSRAPARCT
jgi:Type IV secretory system Conjugative DNA transfer